MAQVQSLHARMLVDSRMRDIRRRVEVIQKKLADLQEMGVPCAFCYSSVRNTGSIFTLGDKRITDVVERYRNEILCNLMEESGLQAGEEAGSSLQEIHLILPVLPAPLEQLSRATLQSMIVGILKDLGIRWSDPTPVWWPAEIPFVPPRAVPENYTGNWLSALRAILKSVYSHFSYDIDSYIASKLESQAKSSEPASTQEGRVGGEDREEEDEDTLSEADADEETYSECEESEGERQAEASHRLQRASKQEVGVVEIPSSPVFSNHSVVLPRVAGMNHAVAAPTSHLKTLSPVAAPPPPPPPPPPPSGTRQLSSFTVENILMSKQHSTSSSSGSVSSSLHSPTSSGSTPSLLPSPTITAVAAPPTITAVAAPPTAAAVNTSVPGSMSSSIVGVNWVSHPPVKYTKFTILSPVAMSDDQTHGGRRSKDNTSLSSKTEEIREGHSVPTPLNTQQHERDGKLGSIMSQVTYVRQPSSEHKPAASTPHQLVPTPHHQPGPPPVVTSTTVRVLSLPPTGTTSASPPSSGGPLRDSPTSASPSHLSTTTATTSSAARLCTLPVVSTLPASSPGMDSRKLVLSKTFPPSQQYVLLVPSSSAVSATAAATSAHSLPSSSSASTLLAQRKPAEVLPVTSGPLVRAGVRTVSFQPPPASGDGGGSSEDKVGGQQLERGPLGSATTEYNSLRLIAPKQRSRLSGADGTDETDPRGSSNRSRPHNNHHHHHLQQQQQQQRGGGTSSRPPKLRFHMTTVVTKQKHAPVVRSSMTVSSPLAMVDESRECGGNGAGMVGRSPESDLPMESIIMRSPNVFSGAQHAKSEGTPHRNPRAQQQVTSRGKVTSSENSTSSLGTADPLQRVAPAAAPRRLALQNGEGPPRGGSRSGPGEAARQKQAPGKLPLTDQQSNDAVSTRHRGRTTRSYTRRKRELTFHLYEDPGTAFRAKRTCKE